MRYYCGKALDEDKVVKIEVEKKETSGHISNSNQFYMTSGGDKDPFNCRLAKIFKSNKPDEFFAVLVSSNVI